MSTFLLPSEGIVQQIFAIIAVFGVTAAANNLYSPVLSIYTLFLILSFFPLTAWFFLQGDYYTLLGTLSLLYIAVMISTAYYTHNLLLTSLNQNDKIKTNSKELKNTLAVTKAILESTHDGI